MYGLILKAVFGQKKKSQLKWKGPVAIAGAGLMILALSYCYNSDNDPSTGKLGRHAGRTPPSPNSSASARFKSPETTHVQDGADPTRSTQAEPTQAPTYLHSTEETPLAGTPVQNQSRSTAEIESEPSQTQSEPTRQDSKTESPTVQRGEFFLPPSNSSEKNQTASGHSSAHPQVAGGSNAGGSGAGNRPDEIGHLIREQTGESTSGGSSAAAEKKTVKSDEIGALIQSVDQETTPQNPDASKPAAVQASLTKVATTQKSNDEMKHLIQDLLRETRESNHDQPAPAEPSSTSISGHQKNEGGHDKSKPDMLWKVSPQEAALREKFEKHEKEAQEKTGMPHGIAVSANTQVGVRSAQQKAEPIPLPEHKMDLVPEAAAATRKGKTDPNIVTRTEMVFETSPTVNGFGAYLLLHTSKPGSYFLYNRKPHLVTIFYDPKLMGPDSEQINIAIVGMQTRNQEVCRKILTVSLLEVDPVTGKLSDPSKSKGKRTPLSVPGIINWMENKGAHFPETCSTFISKLKTEDTMLRE